MVKLRKEARRVRGIDYMDSVLKASRNEQFWSRASRIIQLGIPGPMSQRLYIQGSRSINWDWHIKKFYFHRYTSHRYLQSQKRNDIATILQECPELCDENKWILRWQS